MTTVIGFGRGASGRWKALVLALVFGLLFSVLAGCDGECIFWEDDCDPPAPPRGLYSVTGDNRVDLFWLENTEPDLAGYNVYYSMRERGPYRKIASTTLNHYVDRDVENSETYFYAVTAYDECGNESELSARLVFDTPRPEGRGWVLRNANGPAWNRSGFDFSKYDSYSQGVQAFNSPSTDIFFVADQEGYAMYAGYADEPVGITLIQDAGYVALDDVDYSPEAGWSEAGWVELIEGHSYLVWTRDDHFAKFFVVRVSFDSVTIDWAYQEDRGNPELAPRQKTGTIDPS